MQIHLHGLFLKSMVSLLLMALLASAVENNETMPPGYKKNSTTEAQQLQMQRLEAAFDAFLSSKRKVPNESDPLHNRWSFGDREPELAGRGKYVVVV